MKANAGIFRISVVSVRENRKDDLHDFCDRILPFSYRCVRRARRDGACTSATRYYVILRQ